jgi:hypothetical protein
MKLRYEIHPYVHADLSSKVDDWSKFFHIWKNEVKKLNTDVNVSQKGIKKLKNEEMN